jgi:hypothetical protein
MPASIYDDAKREFSNAMLLVRGNLTFVTAALKLRPRLNGMMDWNSPDTGAVAEAKAFMTFKDIDELYLYSGFVVVIASSFERFVRRLISDAVKHHNKKLKTHADLSVHMLHQNWLRSGQVLTKVFEPPDECDIDYDELSRNLGTTAKGDHAPVMNAEAFSVFLSNFTPDRVVDSMKRIGVELDWDDLGRLPAMQQVSRTTRTKETAKAIKDTLKDFMKKRNRIAHGGSIAAEIRSSDIDNYLSFFAVFSPSIAEITEKHLLAKK